MMNKIAFLCVNPWESFLPPSFQSCGREYYRRVKEYAISCRMASDCREYVEMYGEPVRQREEPFFSVQDDRLQLRYVQSSSLPVLKKLFLEADLVIAGISGSREEFEKLCMAVYPWKEKVLFLWDSHICRDEHFPEMLFRECRLRKAQMVEIRRGCDRGGGRKRTMARTAD